MNASLQEKVGADSVILGRMHGEGADLPIFFDADTGGRQER